MDKSSFEGSEKVCITVLVNHTADSGYDKPLGDYISSKLDKADIYRTHVVGEYSDRDKVIRESYFVKSREDDGWYYTMFLVSVSQKDKAIKLFNRYGVVVDISSVVS